MVAQNKKAGAAGDGGNVFEDLPHPDMMPGAPTGLRACCLVYDYIRDELVRGGSPGVLVSGGLPLRYPRTGTPCCIGGSGWLGILFA